MQINREINYKIILLNIIAILIASLYTNKKQKNWFKNVNYMILPLYIHVINCFYKYNM